MSDLPRLLFSTDNQPEEQAFEQWRTLMAPMYDCKPYSCGGRHPGGSTLAYLLDDVLVNRTRFTAQRVTRDAKLVATTPDHIFFHFWKSGGYSGNIGRQSLEYGPGVVAFSDGQRIMDVCFNPGDTLGLIVPRAHFDGLDLNGLSLRFDPAKSRLLRTRISTLYHGLASTRSEHASNIKFELLSFLRKIVERSDKVDLLEAKEFDADFLALAKQYIIENIGRSDLAVEDIAGALQISRATLYRVLQPEGGVMQFIKELRLLAIRDALMDPLETRSIARLAGSFGMTNSPYLSRSFRKRFDMTPRELRSHWRAKAHLNSQQSIAPLRDWYYSPGVNAHSS